MKTSPTVMNAMTDSSDDELLIDGWYWRKENWLEKVEMDNLKFGFGIKHRSSMKYLKDNIKCRSQ